MRWRVSVPTVGRFAVLLVEKFGKCVISGFEARDGICRFSGEGIFVEARVSLRARRNCCFWNIHRIVYIERAAKIRISRGIIS